MDLSTYLPQSTQPFHSLASTVSTSRNRLRLLSRRIGVHFHVKHDVSARALRSVKGSPVEKLVKGVPLHPPPIPTPVTTWN